MSFLKWTRNIGMNPVGMSIWFRVPADAARAVQNRDLVLDSFSEDITIVNHVVPIMMFGPQRSIDVQSWASGVAQCTYPSGADIPPTVTTTTPLNYIQSVRSEFIQQSCIGVQCLRNQTPTLFIHVQAGNGAKLPSRSLTELGPGYTCPVLGDIGFPLPVPGETDVTSILEGITGGAVGNSDVSNTGVLPSGAFGGKPTLSLNRWHHLQISWKLGAETSVDQTEAQLTAGQPISERISTNSKMFCVLDGVNRTGFDLPATWVGSDGLGTADLNAIVCGPVYANATDVYDPDRGQAPSVATMSYGSVPSNPLWIPGPPSIRTQLRGVITVNQHIELGECQIFPGQVLTANHLGLFLDNKGKPVDPKIARRELGKPAIILHGSNNWKRGKNTGTINANFTPKGKILRYRPDPSLNGPQSPADLNK